MSYRIVTERDLRHPDFRNGEPEDYEFRNDGKIVRKDRWEMAVQHIRGIVGIDARADWEIADVIAAVEGLLSKCNQAPELPDIPWHDAPDHAIGYSVSTCGSGYWIVSTSPDHESQKRSGLEHPVKQFGFYPKPAVGVDEEE